MNDVKKSAWGDERTKYFFELTPDKVIDAVESVGFECTGFCMPLNSFENRVYEVEIYPKDQDYVPRSPQCRRVVKFYRPGRWLEEQILEEHEFELDLVNAEIPAIPPVVFEGGKTLHVEKDLGIFFSIFPKIGGRAPDELNDEQLRRVGRLLARIHSVGAAKIAQHRVRISPESYGLSNLEFLLSGNWIPLEFSARYRESVERICALVAPWFNSTPVHRIHGDCHLGNLLWNDAGPFFLDFDDMLMGPAVQDLWLLLSASGGEGRGQLEVLLEGYEEMREFDRVSLRLIEPLRALRFVHYAAWIARRWEDPAFPAAFPHFGSHRYWSDETTDLERQLRRIETLPDGLQGDRW